MMKKRVGDSQQQGHYLQRSVFIHAIPKSIKALLLYSIATTFFYWFFLFLGFYSLEQVDAGIPVLIIDAVILVLLVAFIYTVVGRKQIAYHLTAVWFIASILI